LQRLYGVHERLLRDGARASIFEHLNQWFEPSKTMAYVKGCREITSDTKVPGGISSGVKSCIDIIVHHAADKGMFPCPPVSGVLQRTGFVGNGRHERKPPNSIYTA